MGVSPIDAPDTPTYVTLDFEAGVPVALDGVKMSAKDIILKPNELGGANGIGLLDIVENRLVGMKCRGVYETPGGTILYAAHDYLETLCLDKLTMHKKQELAITFGELVYDGQWVHARRARRSAFRGQDAGALHRQGEAWPLHGQRYKGRRLERLEPLQRGEIATFGEDHVYDQADSKGFINLFRSADKSPGAG